MAWIDGAIELAMSVSKPGIEKFMTPTWTVGSGGRDAEASRVAVASAMAPAAFSIGFRSHARRYTSSRDSIAPIWLGPATSVAGLAGEAV